jgi:hypothetical protein
MRMGFWGWGGNRVDRCRGGACLEVADLESVVIGLLVLVYVRFSAFRSGLWLRQDVHE